MSQAVERYAPTHQELTPRDLDFIERQAELYSRSLLVPETLRGKAADVALIGVTAHYFGIPFPLALSGGEIVPINGRVYLGSKLRHTLALQHGHRVRIVRSSAQVCEAVLVRRGETFPHHHTVTIEDAKAWRQVGSDKPLADKANWKAYPQLMLRAACIRQLVAMAAPEIILGLPVDATLDDFDESPAEIDELAGDGPAEPSGADLGGGAETVGEVSSAPSPEQAASAEQVEQLEALLADLPEALFAEVQTQARQEAIPHIRSKQRPFTVWHYARVLEISTRAAIKAARGGAADPESPLPVAPPPEAES